MHAAKISRVYIFEDWHQPGACPEYAGYFGPFASNLTIRVPMLTPPPPEASEYTRLFLAGLNGIDRSGSRLSILIHHRSSLFTGFRSLFEGMEEYCFFASSRIMIFPNLPWHSCCVNPNLPRIVAASAEDILFDFK